MYALGLNWRKISCAFKWASQMIQLSATFAFSVGQRVQQLQSGWSASLCVVGLWCDIGYLNLMTLTLITLNILENKSTGTSFKESHVTYYEKLYCNTKAMCLYSLSWRTSNCNILRSLEAARIRLGFKLFQSFWDSTCTSTSSLPRSLSNFKAMQ